MLKRENEKRKLVMLSVITSVLIATTIPSVLGYDHNNPASYVVQYIIPSDTSFDVTICGSETQMIFNATNGSSKLVEPLCQSTITPIKPWATINNTGNLNENFSMNLTTSYPWVVLHVGSNYSMADQVTVTNAQVSPAGWNNVDPKTGSVQLYSMADFTGAPNGTWISGMRISD